MIQHRRETFRRFYEETYTQIRNYVRRRPEISDAEEDIVQEVYELAFKKWMEGALDEHENRIGWLFKVANNIMRNESRRAGRRSIAIDEVAELGDGIRTTAEYRNVEMKLALQKTLTESEMQLFELFYEQSYKTAEIAKILKISEDNVRTRLTRLRRKLRDVFSDMDME